MTFFPSGHSLSSFLTTTYLNHPGIPFPDREVFQRWIVSLFRKLPIHVAFVDYDPYPSMQSMASDIRACNMMKVSTLNNDALLDPLVNLMFRAVHDYDHYLQQASFSPAGEIDAARRFLARCNDELGRCFLFSEIVAQAVVFGETGSFANQKFVPFSQATIDRTIAWGGGSIWP